ncbi:hypothetical protein CRG98_005695, partial [Punica granatum]
MPLERGRGRGRRKSRRDRRSGGMGFGPGRFGLLNGPRELDGGRGNLGGICVILLDDSGASLSATAERPTRPLNENVVFPFRTRERERERGKEPPFQGSASASPPPIVSLPPPTVSSVNPENLLILSSAASWSWSLLGPRPAFLELGCNVGDLQLPRVRRSRSFLGDQIRQARFQLDCYFKDLHSRS